jgi:hypothetical protein
MSQKPMLRGKVLKLHCGKLILAAMAKTVLRLRYRTLTWASAYLHVRDLARGNLHAGNEKRFFRWLFLIGLAAPEESLAVTRHQARRQSGARNFNFAQQRCLLNAPLYCAAFVVNSKPHTGALPSVRLCVGLIKYDEGDLLNIQNLKI